MHFLSNGQKADIAQVAKRAYDGWAGREAFEDANPGLSRSKCFEAWRRYEQGKAVGRQSLTQCTDGDFLPLIAHFQNFMGNGSAALQTLLRQAEAGRITMFFKIQQALAERGLDEAWVAKICRCKYKCALGDASERQLFSLLCDIRRSRKALPKAKQFREPKKIAVKCGTLSVEKLEAQMARAVAEERYEDAAKLRDQLGALAPANPF
ncbi:MAG TPA: UvrB/UvrC motif-containing protein [Rariglobus sp.]|nr:UvrB/UvrC motif-containing protein [Rariglobus sp.]